MTSVIDAPKGATAWSGMPGWSIVGDLTPPEAISSRRLQTLRKMIAVLLGVVVVLCAAGYVYARMQKGNAADDLAAATDRTQQLTVTAGRYAGITRIETTVDGIRVQVASAMSSDVDVARLLTSIRGAVPPAMSLDSAALAVTAATSAGPGGSQNSLDASGETPIGTVTLTGRGPDLTSLAQLVDRLQALPGVVDVVPTSNQESGATTQFTLSLTITNTLYSHAFDAQKKVVK